MDRGTFKIKRDNFKNTTSLLGILFYSVFYLIPVLLILRYASPKNLLNCLSERYNLKVVSFSLKQALLSSLFSLIAGLPGAYILSNKKFKFKSWVRCIYFLPFFLPSILVILGFVIFYGNNGYLNTLLGTNIKFLYSFKAILLAHVFYNFPIISLLVSNSWKNLDRSTLEASRIDGCGRLNTFLKVELPLLLPSIASSFCLVFLYCFTSFAIILVLGGSPSLTTVEVEIYRQAKISLNFETASSLSIISLAVSSLVLSASSYFENRTFRSVDNSQYEPKKRTNLLENLYLFLSCIFISTPIISIVIRSFFTSTSRGSKSSFGIDSYIKIAKHFPSIVNTVLLGICSAVLGTFLAYTLCVFVSKNKRSMTIKNVISMLPMATSSVIIGLGYVFISRFFSFIPSLITIILAHSVIVMPFSLKTLLPVYQTLSSDVYEASMLDGCSQKETFLKIELPLLKNSIASSFVFCFALSCGELNSTMVLGSGKQTTIPILIYRLIESYDYQSSCALGSILVLICILVFVFRIRKD